MLGITCFFSVQDYSPNGKAYENDDKDKNGNPKYNGLFAYTEIENILPNPVPFSKPHPTEKG